MRPSRPLKFCMVTTFYPPYHFGGDGVFVYRLAEALAACGHQVDIVHSVDAYRLRHPGEPEVAFVHHPNVTRHSLESSWPVGSALMAHQLGRPGTYARRLRTLLEGRYDVIHYHNVSLMGAPGVLRLGRAVKLYTAHEYWLVCPTHVLFKFYLAACTTRHCLACTLHSGRPPQLWRYTGLVKRCTRHVDRFLMPSRFALEKHRAEGLDLPMVHFPHFVPSIQGERSAAPANGRAYFVFAGRLEKLKGAHDLVRLFANYREADLLIAGTGSDEAALREQARSLPHIKFLGPLHPARLADIYSAALAVLVPSLCYETFGLTAAEAAAHGTPAIVRDLGALPEIVEQTGAGFTFTSLEECRGHMERLRTQPDLREAHGHRARLAAQQSWSLEAHLARYLELVSGLLEERAGSTGATPVASEEHTQAATEVVP